MLRVGTSRTRTGGNVVVDDFVSKNIVTDFGAVGDGTTDSYSAFLAFNAWAIAQTKPVLLTIPAGNYVNKTDWCYWALGISNLTVSGYGATLSNAGASNSKGWVMSPGGALYEDRNHHARTQSVAAGASSVILAIPAKASLFVPGSYALMTGYDMQGYGYPVNPHFFEYCVITGSNASTGVVTFSAPLRNTYLSTWPDYNYSGGAGIDQGGPATLYALPANFACQAEYLGLTLDQPNCSTYGNGLSITYKDCTFTGTLGPIPSMNVVFSLISCSVPSASVEVDKLIDTLTIKNSSVNTLVFQSDSTHNFVCDGSTVDAIVGTPLRTEIKNGSVITDLDCSPGFYGITNELTASNSIIVNFETTLPLNPPQGHRLTAIDSSFTMSAGVITIPNTGTPSTDALNANWAIPRAYAILGDTNRKCLQILRTLSVTQDSSNVYVQTDASSGFPAHSGGLSIQPHPCPNLTFTNCSGIAPAGVNDNSVAWGLSQAPAGAPLGSYFQHTYNGSEGQTEAAWYSWGNLESLTVTVNTPYTHGALTFDGLGWYCWTQDITSIPSVPTTYVPVVNAAIAGTRSLTFSGSTPTIVGLKSGDSGWTPAILPPWLADREFGYWGSVITPGDASITVTWSTDQMLASFFLREDGSSKILLENGTNKLGLE